jgi:hypothetical protein
MSLQTILSISESLTINDHKFAGQMLSRNLRLSVSEILTVQPFLFSLKPMNYLLYSQNRGVLSALRQADRIAEQYLNLGSTGWLNYIAYQGDMTAVQAAAVQISSASTGQTITLTNLPSISASAYVVKVGDFIQLGRYAYIATASVQRGGGSTVDVPVHRPLMTTLAAAIGAVIGQYGTTVALGGVTYTGVTFPVIVREYPTYTLVPITNDSFISWEGKFSAMEWVI